MSKSVLITGAGTGLGLTTALHLARHNYRVYASIPDEEQRHHLSIRAQEENCDVHILALDVTRDLTIQAALEFILEESGSLDAVINNAGISLRGYFEDCLEEEIRRVIEINVYGTMKVTRYALPLMRLGKGGHVVFVSSIGGLIGAMARTAYCASKFAIEGFAESLSQEVQPFGIQVSIIEPAIIATERWTVNRGIARNAESLESPYHEWFRREEELADRLVRTSPTKPIDVAEAIRKALQSSSPALRRIVGRRAAWAVRLRRYLPGDVFERIFFGQAIKRVTGS